MSVFFHTDIDVVLLFFVLVHFLVISIPSNPPNYSQEGIESWKRTLSNLKKVRPSWKDWDKDSDFYDAYKSDIRRINEIIDLRISRIGKILSRMEGNQWLTDEEQR